MLLLDLSLKLIEIQQFSASNVNQTEWYLCCIFHFGRRAIWLFAGLLPFSRLQARFSLAYIWRLDCDCTIKFGLTIKFISFSICSEGSESRLARTFVFIHFRFDSSSQFNRCSSSSYVYCKYTFHSLNDPGPFRLFGARLNHLFIIQIQWAVSSSGRTAKTRTLCTVKQFQFNFILELIFSTHSVRRSVFFSSLLPNGSRYNRSNAERKLIDMKLDWFLFTSSISHRVYICSFVRCSHSSYISCATILCVSIHLITPKTTA